MKANSRRSAAVLLFVLGLFVHMAALGQERVSVGGNIIFGSTPLCALVLINGASQFSCDGTGRYDLNVPLDGNGMVTVQSFADGFAPVNEILTPAQAAEYKIEMFRVDQGASFEVTTSVEPSSSAGRFVISGTVNSNSIPVCALVLANGQKMFSCEENLGQYSLDVPLDTDGNITLMVFAAGFQPYKKILNAANATNNFTAVSLENDTLDPRIGYPLRLTLTIDAVETANNVPVGFYAFDPNNVGSDPISLGASAIEVVSDGSNAYAVEINIPSDVENPQSYFIGASIDPADGISETNEEDNQTSTEVTFSAPLAPNLFIELMEPDRTALVLDRTAWNYEEQISTTGEIASDAGGTVIWGGQGIEQPIAVEAFAVLRLIRSDKSPSTTLDVPLYLWDSEFQRYMNAYGVDPVLGGFTGIEEWLPIGQIGQPLTASESEFDPRSVHLDFYFPGRLASEIEIALRNLFVLLGGPIVPPPDLSAEYIQTLRTFLFGADLGDVNSEFCVSIRPANQSIVEDRTDDNIICSPLELVLPPLEPAPPRPPIVPPVVPPIYITPVDPIFNSAHYSAGWPGAFFGVSLDFSTSSSVDSNGIVVTGLAEIPVTIFGSRFQFVGIESRAQVLPDSDRFATPQFQPEPGLTLSIESLDQVIYTTDRPPESTGEISLSYSIEVPDPEKLGYCCLVGPVPINYKSSVSGNVGIEGEVEFESQGFAYKTTFFESAEVSFEAFANLVVARIGAEGVVTLLKYAFPIENKSTINIRDDRHPNGTSEIEIINEFLVKNEISGPEGAINAFAEVGGGEKCNWGIFSFICKALPTFRYTLNILKWEPFKKLDITLRHDIEVIDIVTLPDGTVIYYGD